MATTMNQGRTCPKCGKPTATGELADLCPACLLAQGLETEPGTGPRVRFEAPPLERITRLFPQLEVLGLIGSGGMGAVYKARQPPLDRIVALKVLPASSQPGNRFEERFNREARALARLNHPHIVTVHEFGQVEDLHFFLMEFVDGTNLRQLEKTSRLSPREALQIIPQLCDALQYAHDEGVVHRDIKPENVLVDRKGRVKIADFGLAKILDPSADAEAARLTVEGQVMGTPHYMAPEQLEKPLAVDHRADIYSLGVVFYEMLTGDLPLGNFAPPSRKVQVDVRLDEVVLRALENDPTRRYQQAGEVKTRLQSIADTAPEPTASAAAKPSVVFLRFAGFPVVAEKDGIRSVHRPGVAKGFAVLFGVLTVIMGCWALVRGGYEAGWFGLVGWPSVVIRIAISGLLMAWGVRSARRKKLEPRIPAIAPVVVLPSEGTSRKAVLGAVCLALGFVALALFLTPMAHTTNPLQSAAVMRVQGFLVGLIVVTILLAPVCATFLGWIAVRDIRQSRGRLGGLKLAVFDGLVVPLGLINSILIFVLRGGLSFAEGTGWHSSSNLTANLALGWLLILAVNWILVRAIWNRVRLDESPERERWWCQAPAITALAITCLLVIQVTTQLRASRIPSFGMFSRPPNQIATEDEKGALIAVLPNGSQLELLAVETPQHPESPWSLPNGTPLPQGSYSITNSEPILDTNSTATRLILRLTGSSLPLQSIGFFIAQQSMGGSMQSSGNVYPYEGVLKDGKPLPGAFYIWKSQLNEGSEKTFRLAVDLDPWQVIATADVEGRNRNDAFTYPIPGVSVRFQPAGEYKGRTRLTTIAQLFDPDLDTAIRALGTNGTVLSQTKGEGGTSSYGTMTLFSEFDVPLREIRGFQMSVRKHHWIEFQKVIQGTRAIAPPEPAAIPTATTAPPLIEVRFPALLDLDTGHFGDLPTAFENQTGNPMAEIGSTIEFMQSHGYDVMHSHDHLDAIGLKLVPLQPGDWELITARELQLRLETAGTLTSKIRPASFPADYGFQTREGGTGLMEIVKISGEMTVLRIKRIPR